LGGWLGLASALLVALTTLVVWLVDGEHRLKPLTIFWDILFQALTPNPVATDAGSVPFLLAMLFITLGSLFMVSILIGILVTGIEDRLHSLRKGRSRVLERDHTVILGWNEHIFTIISELMIANENQPKSRSCIVILGDKDKVEMEDEIQEKIHSNGHTRVVCRSGSPIDHFDLELVNLNAARSIIVLEPDDNDPDAQVIKVMLAIVNNRSRRTEPYLIVAEIHDPHNLDAARLAAGDEAELVLVGRLTSRIIAQTCRRSGLSTVYTELLNFEGDEIYFQAEPDLVGKTFGEALFAYEDSAVVGIRLKGDGPKLNPPMDTCIQDGDLIIALSEDDDTIRLSGIKDPAVDTDAIVCCPPVVLQPERTLVLGWNWRASTVVVELDHYVAPGSLITVVAEDPDIGGTVSALGSQLTNASLEFKQGNTTDRRTLLDLDVETYQHVIVLSYSDALPMQKADARTLVTLLHLRDIAGKSSQRFSIVSEMLDERNRDLAEVTQADDFIVSGKLSSLLLAQISENRELHAVFEDVFDAEGAEVYLNPASDYVQPGMPVNFYTVLTAALWRNETAIGYRLHADANDPDKGYGVVANPKKSVKVTFGEKDRIIVLAENERRSAQ
jgi:voltage-gated potassium channel Kch